VTELIKTVVVLDDEAAMIDALRIRFEIRGWRIRHYLDAKSFAESEFHSVEAAVFIVDHDLGNGVIGYDIVRELRQTRPDGLALPVVYLTGRESEKSYLERRLEKPNLRPSCFVSKSRVAHVDLLEICADLLAHFQEVLDQEQSQALRRAAAQVAARAPSEDAF